MGLGFTFAITIVASIRELLGSGTVFGRQLMPPGYEPMAFVVSPAGGFVVLGLTLAVVNFIFARREAAK